MKKLLSILALALCFVACQNEGVENATNGDLANVVLTVDAPELDVTRADGDANTGKNSAFGAIDFFNDADWANFDLRYILEVYDANDDGTGEPIYRERLVECVDKYTPVTFDLRLVPNREYKFVVFADFVEQGETEDLYYDTTDFSNITAKTNVEGWNAMNEARDAYFVSENVEVSTSLTKTLTLTRPFGKVRVIATDLDYIAGYSAPGYVEVTYHTEALYKSFNAINGQLNATQLAGNELVYGFEVKKDAPYTEGYDAEAKNQTLFADYLFAREGQQMPINFKMAVYESKGGRKIKETDFNTQIPVQRNHLTTIIGDVLTTEANITIVVNDDFVEEMINPSMEVAPAAPAVTATVEGNTVTLAWEAVEGAAMYFTRLVAEGNVAFEKTTELTKVYSDLAWETEYKFEVYAVSENDIVSETVVVKATTEKEPKFEPVASAWALVGVFSEWKDQAMFTTPDENIVVLEDVALKAAEGFLVRKPATEWADKYGAGNVNYIKADHYITTTKEGADMCVEADGTYDIYFNISTKALYVMVADTDLTKATEQTVNGEEPKQEEPEVTEKVVYLKPNANWTTDGARFAAYFWNDGGNAWVSMTAVEEGIYQVNLPEGYDYGCNVIFCRMNPSTTANNWNNKWNQTGDLKVPTDGKNLFTLAASAWDGATTTWSVYTPAVVEPTEPVALATPDVKASVEGNVVTLTWETIENASQYGITVGTEMPVFVEETTYVFTGEYETEYTFNVVAVPEDEEKFAASEAAVVTATTEAEPAEEVVYTTVAEFLAAAEDDTIYTLKGTITSVTETSYGNFYINDGTGEVLIYGLCSPEGAQKYWAQSGAKVGDDIVIKTVRTSYNSAPQGKNAIFVELITPGTLAFWSFEATSASFTAAAAEKTIAVAIYNATSEVKTVSDNAQFSAVYSAGVLTISAKENTTADAIEGNITVTCGDLSQVIAVSQLGASSGDAVAVEAKISFADKVNRTEYSTSKQVWEQNGIVVTNNKGASTSNVGDYANPARFYKSSNVTIQAPGEIISISIDCKGLDAKYVTPWGTADNGIVTITLDGTSDTYTLSNLSAQARAYSMTVTYLE